MGAERARLGGKNTANVRNMSLTTAKYAKFGAIKVGTGRNIFQKT